MVQEPLFEYVGIHLTGYTVVNSPDNDDEETPDEPELVLLDTELV